MPSGWRRSYSRYRKYFEDIYNVYNQKPDVKMFLELILTLVVIAFFGMSALRPTVLTIIDLTEQIKQKQEVSDKMATKIQNLNTAQNLVASQENQISLLETAVPNTPLPDNFVRQVEGLSQKNSVQVLGISSGDVLILGINNTQKKSRDFAPLPDDANELPFTISVSGGFGSLNSFLSDFEKMRRPAKIDSAVINESKTDTGTILVLIISGRLPFID